MARYVHKNVLTLAYDPHVMPLCTIDGERDVDGWTKHETYKGKTFYWHAASGETSWTLPSPRPTMPNGTLGPARPAAGRKGTTTWVKGPLTPLHEPPAYHDLHESTGHPHASTGRAPALPLFWEERVARDGSPYFQHMLLNQTCWSLEDIYARERRKVRMICADTPMRLNQLPSIVDGQL